MSLTGSNYRIFAVDDDVNACKSAHFLSGPSNNNFQTVGPSPVSHPAASSNLVVGSPTCPRPAAVPRRGIRTPQRHMQSKSPVVKAPPNTPKMRSVNNNNDSMRTAFNKLSLGSSSNESTTDQRNEDLSQFEHSMLSRDEYYAKTGSLNDAYKEREECPLLAKIVDKELGMFEALDCLRSVTTEMALTFLKTHRGSRFIRDAMEANGEFCSRVSKFILQSRLAVKLALSPSGNFVVQCMTDGSYHLEEELCDQLKKHVLELTVDKYGCRVIQAVISKVHPMLVKRLVDALQGSEIKVCKDKNGTHVALCLLANHNSSVFEKFFLPFTNPAALQILMEDKFGCRVVQKCLEALASEINATFVPALLNNLIIPLLQDARRYVMNEFANYVIQKIMEHPAFKRQRDYIIDHVLLHNMLRLSQGKFSSHVVERALDEADSDRLVCMCNEIFYDHKIVEKGKTPLEIMLFDQYANYVIQRLLQIAIDVCTGKRQGDPNWINILNSAVARNEARLRRYSSGKKILDILSKCQPTIQGAMDYHQQQQRRVFQSGHYQAYHY